MARNRPRLDATFDADAARALIARMLKPAPEPRRCPWCGDDPLYVAYHDHEWGFPVGDDRPVDGVDDLRDQDRSRNASGVAAAFAALMLVAEAHEKVQKKSF